jgi:O-antigen chain-terminating methyltransferase
MSEFEHVYAAFEARFRGSRELILQRMQAYAPLLALAEQRLSRPWRAVDYGCGRGEWLQLVRGRGWDAIGIDTNPSMLREAAALSLQVQCGDMIEHISAQPAQSVVLVSAFHVVEHIPQDAVFDFVRHAARVLLPGGLLILETPNPENVAVGTSNFYLDPTHQRPIPPLLLQFVVQQAGFEAAHVVRLNGEAEEGPARTLEQVLRPLFSRAPDYAIVATRGADEAWLVELARAAQTVSQRPPVDLEALHSVSQALHELTQQLPIDLRESIDRLAEVNERSIMRIGGQLERIEQKFDVSLRTVFSDAEARQALQSAVESRRQLLVKWKEWIDARAVYEERERDLRARYQALLDSTAADRHRLAQLDAQLLTHGDDLARRDAALAAAQERGAALEGEVQSTRQRLHDANAAAAASAQVVAQMEGSRSWRLTRPLRAVTRRLRALRNRLRSGGRAALVRAADRLAVLASPLLRFAFRHPRLKQLLRAMAGRWPRARDFALRRLRAIGLLPTPMLSVGTDDALQGLPQDIEQLLATLPPRSRALYLALQEDLTNARATTKEHAAAD